MNTTSIPELDRRLFDSAWRRLEKKRQGEDVDLTPVATCVRVLRDMGETRREFESRVGNHARSILRRAVRNAFGLDRTPNDASTIHRLAEMRLVFESPLTAEGDDCDRVIKFCKYVGSTAQISS